MKRYYTIALSAVLVTVSQLALNSAQYVLAAYFALITFMLIAYTKYLIENDY